jgi:hypothetical protein
MGTSGAYGGSGGKDGRAVRDAITDYLQDAAGPATETKQPDPDDQQPAQASQLDPEALRRILNLIHPRSSGGGGDGPGGGGARRADPGRSRSGGGPQRSAARSATTAGRAAAGAYAYRTGDAATLERLGLDYAGLRALGDDFEVLRRIVNMACGSADSTIEDYEQRLVAADVAEWVFAQEDDGYLPTPEETVRHAIGLIIAEAILSEAGNLINSTNQATLTETDVRDAAEALANRADLSVYGATEAEIARAIETGIDTLRDIRGRSR